MSYKKRSKEKKIGFSFLGVESETEAVSLRMQRRDPQKSGATTGGPTQGPGGLTSTYQAKPRHVPSDSRLTPVRGSTQPEPLRSRASTFFPPSLRFPRSAGAPLGPDFFRLLTSDMSGGPEHDKPGAASTPWGSWTWPP